MSAAITVNKVHKQFILPHERHSSIKQKVTGLFKSKNKGFEIQHALKDISFSIQEGEFFGIVGRNGSGKSTLLKMLAGIYQPTTGNIAVEGKLVPFIELGVGFNPELTGRENVYLNGALLGFSKKEIDAQYDDIVRFAELEAFMDQKLKNYSSGMQVRLAFSVATTAKADILLIDEVLAVGDADFQRKCFDYFKHLKKAKTTVVFVSHDMSAVREYCDRAVLIDKSKLVAEGNPNDIAREYTHLFNQNEGGRADDEELTSKRWGDGQMSYSSVEVTPKAVNDEVTKVVISAKVKVLQTIEEPVFGFSIKAPTGQELLGTNTRIMERKSGTWQAGETHTISWQVPNIFSEGQHAVDITATHEDVLTVCDWWEEAASFRVRKDQKTPYPVSPVVDVTLG
jgi:ABC-2 type transport system ATP-binding protein